MTETPASAFWIDADYDTEHASNGNSRYGAYILQNLDGFTECWDGTWDTALPVHFAAQAWRVATGPIMAPGYVHHHARVLSARLEHNYADASLAANVELITPWPQALRQSIEWMQQTDRGWWHDWPTTLSDTYIDPGEEDVSKRPYLLASAVLRFTVPGGQLPDSPSAGHTDDELVGRAMQSVAAVVVALNRIVGPVIRTLEAS
jgi:hypothetical protein